MLPSALRSRVLSPATARCPPVLTWPELAAAEMRAARFITCSQVAQGARALLLRKRTTDRIGSTSVGLPHTNSGAGTSSDRGQCFWVSSAATLRRHLLTDPPVTTRECLRCCAAFSPLSWPVYRVMPGRCHVSASSPVPPPPRGCHATIWSSQSPAPVAKLGCAQLPNPARNTSPAHLAAVGHAAGHGVQPRQHLANVDAGLEAGPTEHGGGGHLAGADRHGHRHLLAQLVSQELIGPGRGRRRWRIGLDRVRARAWGHICCRERPSP
jgi:hypothetical protein